VVPYSPPSIFRYLKQKPEKHCTERTARQMAMQAFLRARRYANADGKDQEDRTLAGVACTASLATNRPKKGPHRVHLALQTIDRTMSWSVHLEKNVRTRLEEEDIVCQSIINLLAQASEISDQLATGLSARDHFQERLTLAPMPWRDLYFGPTQAIEHQKFKLCSQRYVSDEPAKVSDDLKGLFPGAFHPMHHGHRRMKAIAEKRLGGTVAFESSVKNVDKAPMDYIRMEEVLSQLEGEERLWLTNAARFHEKAQLFPGKTFIVGMDTLLRIADPRYYGGDRETADAVFKQFEECGVRFLVFARHLQGEIRSFPEEGLPDRLASLCEGVPTSDFCEDISSTEIRENGIFSSHR
jgi:hypothetical protein